MRNCHFRFGDYHRIYTVFSAKELADNKIEVFEGIGMKTMAILILLLMLNGFLTPVSADSGKRLKITAEKSSHQFPFFDTQTPVWAYNGSIPGPTIRGRQVSFQTPRHLKRGISMPSEAGNTVSGGQ